MIQVTTDELNVAEHLAAVADTRMGAVVSFIGQIRDHDPEIAGDAGEADQVAARESGMGGLEPVG